VRKYLFLLISLFLAACSGTTTPQAQYHPAALIAIPTIQPTETVTPSPTAAPTFDANIYATQTQLSVLQSEADAAQRQADAAAQLVALDRERSNIRATEQAVSILAGNATQTQTVIDASNTQTAQQAAQQMSIIAGVATATKQADLLALKKAEQDLTFSFWGKFSALAIFFAIVMAVIFVVTGQIQLNQRRELQAIGEVNVMEGVPVQPKQVTYIERDVESTTVSRIQDPPGDANKIRAWAIVALQGQSIAVDPWETAGSPFTKSEYRHGLYQWVLTNRLDCLNAKGERVLNANGGKVVREWLERNPPPSPSVETTSKTAIIPAVHTDSRTDSAGGGA
jgi:hypothetical protein